MAQAGPTYEYMVPHRFIRATQAGPSRRVYFGTAQAAFEFAMKIEATAIYSVCRREVGSWEQITAKDLEADAAGERAI